MTLYCSFPLHIPKTLQTQKTDSIFVHWLLRYSIFCCLLGGLLVPLAGIMALYRVISILMQFLAGRRVPLTGDSDNLNVWFIQA